MQIMSEAYTKGIAILCGFLDKTNPDDATARKQLINFDNSAKNFANAMGDDAENNNSDATPYYFTENNYHNLEIIFELSQNNSLLQETRRQIILDLAEKLNPAPTGTIPDIKSTVDRLSAATSGLSPNFVEKTAKAIHASIKEYMDSRPELTDSTNKSQYQSNFYDHVCAHFGLQKSTPNDDVKLSDDQLSDFFEHIKSSLSPERVVSEMAETYHGIVINSFKHSFPKLSALDEFDAATYQEFNSNHERFHKESYKTSFGEIVNERLIYEIPDKPARYKLTDDKTSLKAKIFHLLHKENPNALEKLKPKDFGIDLIESNGGKIKIKQIGNDFTYAILTNDHGTETYCSLDKLLWGKNQQSMDLLKQIMEKSIENSDAKKISNDYLIKISISIAQEMANAETVTEAKISFENSFFLQHFSPEKLVTTEALEYTLRNKKPEISRLLMTRMDSIPFDDNQCISASSALITALSEKQFDIAKFLIDKMSPDQLSIRDKHGRTALFMADYSHIETDIRKTILNKIWQGTTYLETIEKSRKSDFLAHHNEDNEENQKIREILIKNYYLPDINIRSNSDGMGKTWLEYSIRTNAFESLCKLFIENMIPAQLENTDADKNTTLMRALSFNPGANPDILNLLIEKMSPEMLGIINSQGLSALRIGLQNKNTPEDTLILLFKKMRREDFSAQFKNPSISTYITKNRIKLFGIIVDRMGKNQFTNDNNTSRPLLETLTATANTMNDWPEVSSEEVDSVNAALTEKIITAAIDKDVSVKNIDTYLNLLKSLNSQRFRPIEDLINEISQDQLGIVDNRGKTLLTLMLEQNEIGNASAHLISLYERHRDAHPNNDDSDLSIITNGNQALLDKVNSSIQGNHKDARLDYSAWSTLTVALQMKKFHIIKLLINKMSSEQISIKSPYLLTGTALDITQKQIKKLRPDYSSSALDFKSMFGPGQHGMPVPQAQLTLPPVQRGPQYIPQPQAGLTQPRTIYYPLPQMAATVLPLRQGPQYSPAMQWLISPPVEHRLQDFSQPQPQPRLTQAGTTFPPLPRIPENGPQLLPIPPSFSSFRLGLNLPPAPQVPKYNPPPLQQGPQPRRLPPEDLETLLGFRNIPTPSNLNIELSGTPDLAQIGEIYSQLLDIETLILSKFPVNYAP